MSSSGPSEKVEQARAKPREHRRSGGGWHSRVDGGVDGAHTAFAARTAEVHEMRVAFAFNRRAYPVMGEHHRCEGTLQ